MATLQSYVSRDWLLCKTMRYYFTLIDCLLFALSVTSGIPGRLVDVRPPLRRWIVWRVALFDCFVFSRLLATTPQL